MNWWLNFIAINIFLFSHSPASAISETQRSTIVNEAKTLCSELNLNGNSSKIIAEGKFGIELNVFLKKLIDAGIISEAEIELEDFQNVPREQLFDLINSIQECRKYFFEKLVEITDRSGVVSGNISGEDIGFFENKEYSFKVYLSQEKRKSPLDFKLNRFCKLYFQYPDGMGVSVFMQLFRNNESLPLIDIWLGYGSAPDEIEVPDGRYRINAVLREGGYSPRVVVYGIKSSCE